MSALTLPTVHLNGTGWATLVDDYRAASMALAAACRALEGSAPNGRDYYPQGPQALRSAQTEHWSRIQRLTDVRTELESILDHLEGCA